MMDRPAVVSIERLQRALGVPYNLVKTLRSSKTRRASANDKDIDVAGGSISMQQLLSTQHSYSSLHFLPIGLTHLTLVRLVVCVVSRHLCSGDQVYKMATGG